MTTKRRTAKTLFYGVTFLALAGMPASAFASVEITEVMYDAPGTDSGREWIEVTNAGSDPVDLSSYKLFENNTNHALTPVSGDGTLGANASAVLVEDPAKFAADEPNYSGPEFKASFSLSNTGETLALKSGAGDIVDSISYDSSMGAAGDGNSLHRVGSSFEAGAPDPGVFSNSTPAPVVVTSDSGSSAPAPTSLPQTSGSPSTKTLSVRITADDNITAGAGSFFSGSVSEGSDVRYLWNFGDGSTVEGQTVMHTYSYPGQYAVVLTAASGGVSGMARASIAANPAQLGLLIEPDGSAVLKNESSHELSVGLWSITSGTSTFVIPQNTYILGSQSVRFTTGVMGMVAGQDALVRYPNGLAATTKNELPPVSLANAAPITAHSPVRVVYVPAPVSKPISEVAAPTSTAPVRAEAEQPASQAAAAAASGAPMALWEGVLGLVALILLGVSGAWYTQALAGAKPEVPLSAEHFSIDD